MKTNKSYQWIFNLIFSFAPLIFLFSSNDTLVSFTLFLYYFSILFGLALIEFFHFRLRKKLKDANLHLQAKSYWNGLWGARKFLFIGLIISIASYFILVYLHEELNFSWAANLSPLFGFAMFVLSIYCNLSLMIRLADDSKLTDLWGFPENTHFLFGFDHLEFKNESIAYVKNNDKTIKIGYKKGDFVEEIILNSSRFSQQELEPFFEKFKN